MPTTEDLLRRVRGEFIEMPGLCLTEAQARRLWDLDATVCSSILDTLIASRFLLRTTDGNLIRAEQATSARASLRPRTHSRVA